MNWPNVIFGIWALNALLVVVWMICAKYGMRKRGISWSGGYDAIASCLMLWAIFLPPIGTFFLVWCILAKVYE